MGHAVGTEVTKMRRGRGGDPLRGNAKGPEPEGRGHVRRPSDPTHVAVLMDVADLEAFQAAMESEGAAEAVAYDGVLPETLVILVEA